MKITVLTVGKKHDSAIADAINEYISRLNRVIKTEWQIIAPSGKDNLLARDEESTVILNKIDQKNTVWLLDERGDQIDSPSLAQYLTKAQFKAEDLVIIIGGAYGVNDSVRERADFVWSLSKLIFPHQLVRLIMAEQLYRATEITRGSNYHHL
jgi:23S rRNA (pseudouridine1915-N3)-methyltransferase